MPITTHEIVVSIADTIGTFDLRSEKNEITASEKKTIGIDRRSMWHTVFSLDEPIKMIYGGEHVPGVPRIGKYESDRQPSRWQRCDCIPG